MADEIRTKEAGAREIVVQAKSEAARIVAGARTAAEQSVKEARQKSHRYFRDQVKAAEAEAEAKAASAVASGRDETEAFYNGNKSRTASVTDWLIKEVMSTYGNS
jgi:vacuolar-type H+-ATPase subunit H